MGISDALEEKQLALYEYLLTTVIGEWNTDPCGSPRWICVLGHRLSGQVCEDQERGRKWGCLRGVTLLLERNKQLSIHISPKIPQEKKRGSKMTSKKYEDKETRLALPKKIRLFTLQYRFSLEELLGLIWSLWRQELSCGKSGNNTSAGKSGRAQGEEKKFRIGFLSSRHQARMLFTSVSSSSHYSP